MHGQQTVMGRAQVVASADPLERDLPSPASVLRRVIECERRLNQLEKGTPRREPIVDERGDRPGGYVVGRQGETRGSIPPVVGMKKDGLPSIVVSSELAVVLAQDGWQRVF